MLLTLLNKLYYFISIPYQAWSFSCPSQSVHRLPSPPPAPDSGILTPLDIKFVKFRSNGFSGLRAVEESSVGGHIVQPPSLNTVNINNPCSHIRMFVKSKVQTRFLSNCRNGGSSKNQRIFVWLLFLTGSKLPIPQINKSWEVAQDTGHTVFITSVIRQKLFYI